MEMAEWLVIVTEKVWRQPAQEPGGFWLAAEQKVKHGVEQKIWKTATQDCVVWRLVALEFRVW